jgi:hypothetical protein
VFDATEQETLGREGVVAVWSFAGDGGADADVEPELTGRVTIDGQLTEREARLGGPSAAFAGEEGGLTIERGTEGFDVVFSLGRLRGASELDRLNRVLEESGSGTDALIEDRDSDGVLEVDVDVSGEVEYDGSTTDVDLTTSFTVVESEPDGSDAAPVDPAPGSSTDSDLVEVTFEPGAFTITAPSGESVRGRIPDGWDIDRDQGNPQFNFGVRLSPPDPPEGRFSGSATLLAQVLDDDGFAAHVERKIENLIETFEDPAPDRAVTELSITEPVETSLGALTATEIRGVAEDGTSFVIWLVANGDAVFELALFAGEEAQEHFRSVVDDLALEVSGG